MSEVASRWSIENIARVQAEILDQPSPAAEVRDERYHDSAAVVTRFAIAPSFHRDPEATRNLLVDSVLAEERDGGQYWALKNEVRKRVLARLRTRSELTRALGAAPARPTDVLQRVFESWIFSAPKPLNQQSPAELSATMQVIDWLETTEFASSLPQTADVRRRVEYASLLQPFRDLVGDHFRGRSRELGVLRDYLNSNLTSDALRPLLIFGPGGMGKSTLLSKFILEALAEDSSRAIVYLDCDRPGMVAEEPLTLLAEAVHQLGLQFPPLYDSAARLRESWLAELAELRASASDTLESASLESVATRDRSAHIQSFALFAHELPETTPVLIVIDTFEELQYRSRDFVGELFTFLREVHQAIPRVRVVISGRDEVRAFETEPLPLTELDREAAEGYLAARGVAPEDLRKALARALHGNPLSLRLAATLLTVDTVSTAELGNLERIVDDTQIQGILYRRILAHLHDKDEELERIAHPGLILRRITPDLIRYAIAEPCGLTVDSDDRARSLFDRLQAELSLVIRDGDGVRHRPDVRRVMLPALRAAERERTDAIQQAAIDYYTDFDDAASRAEELYHRLMLGQPAEQIEPRWSVPGVDDFLRSALDDVTGPGRGYLASRLGIELYDDDLDTLEPLVWERTAANRAESLIRLDRPQDALRLMHTRSSRSPGSPLYWLEARLLRQLGRDREARQVARDGIASLGNQPIPLEQLDLFVLSAEADENLGGPVNWDEVLLINRRLMSNLGEEPRRVRFALAYLRLAARTSVEPRAIDALIYETTDALKSFGHRDLAALVQELPPIPAFDELREMASTARTPTQHVRAPARELYAVNPANQPELVDALVEAFPTLADIHLLMTHVDKSIAAMVTLDSTVKEACWQLLRWAETQNRTGELMSAALTLNPKAPRLLRLVIREGTRIETPDADPFDTALLPGGRPFLGRMQLRAFMRDQLQPTPQRRVLSIVGPRGSGKSYTREYLGYLSSATGAFELGYFDMNASWSLTDLLGAIHGAFGHRWEYTVDPDVPVRALVGQYANQVINMGRRTRRITTLFFDPGEQEIRPEVRLFIEDLAERISTLAVPLVVVFSGLEALNVHEGVVENIGQLSEEDLVAGLRQLAPGSDATSIGRAVDEILTRVPAIEPNYNAQVNRLAASYAASLIDAGAPVRMYISYAPQDAVLRGDVWEQLTPLREQGLLRAWSDQDIAVGVEWRSEIARELAQAEIVLLLLTQAYIRLKHLDSLPLEELFERRDKGELLIIAVKLEKAIDVQELDPSILIIERDVMVDTISKAAVEIRRRRAERGGNS